MGNPAAVWKRLIDEVAPIDLAPPKPSKKRKRRLTSDEYHEILTNYWDNRPETAHDYELFVEAAIDWVIFAFLYENSDHGKGRNHEIEAGSTIHELVDHLDDSCLRMMRDITCRVEMRSVCWWDVQEHYHNLRRRDINRLADELLDPLIFEAIKRLKTSGFLAWHSGFWTLSARMSAPYIQQLKARGRIFLAPEPSKLSRVYAA